LGTREEFINLNNNSEHILDVVYIVTLSVCQQYIATWDAMKF